MLHSPENTTNDILKQIKTGMYYFLNLPKDHFIYSQGVFNGVAMEVIIEKYPGFKATVDPHCDLFSKPAQIMVTII